MTLAPDTVACTRSAAPTIRAILTHVAADPKELPRLQAAVALARRLDATCIGLGCEMVPPLETADPSGLMQGEWYVAMQEQVRAELDRAREIFLREANGVRSDWICLQEAPSTAIARLSRSADLIVAGGSALRHAGRHRSVDTAETLMRSGRPVLVVPPSGGALSARAVVIAWKDTREARRALSDAMPFLATAEKVLIVDVCREDEMADAEIRTAAVAAHLARHDIVADVRIAVAQNHRVVAELNVAAEAIGADLIVAGGYGHSRLGEWFFGGVTDDLLNHPERFVLLSH